ncbi:MAG: AAA family ATPase, partial [Actinomycetota bacterium]|nr:AAA family ATPase [Actinomycetota bacterium]
MFLKTLTIKGFKSFADTTTLAMEPGVTVVVGPNGSGKSNVVDAIGWVLGAQAPSAVRSQKMDDVIFAGTQHRAALGRAEVSLTIDNSAGLLPIDFTEVTVTRTLFRAGDSEYAMNGVPCRLLDIQELLSDTGVGRQQHVIISQGQIDAVLTARPEERRLIIEEAAGVLKFRRRKEKAERRLTSTEGNLTRLQDLLREVRRQLRPLERQADAARRYGAVVDELTNLRRYIAGQELTRLQARLEASGHVRRELADQEQSLRSSLRQLDADVATTESKLSAKGGDDLGEALVRFESLRERARGLVAVLAERARGISRDRGASVDRAVIATLEAEAARLAGELTEVEAGAAALLPTADRLAAAERSLAVDRERFADDWADGVMAPSGRAAEVRGELFAMRAAVERGEAEAERARARLASLSDKVRRLTGESERLAAEVATAAAAEGPLVDQLAAAETAGRSAESDLTEAEHAFRSAETERHAWAARVEALTAALDERRASAGAERLAGVDGVIGTLLETVDIDAGWEAAFEAAASDALTTVLVDDAPAGRRALRLLEAGEVSGAVLVVDTTSAEAAVSGGGAARPPVGELLRHHVRSHGARVDHLLDLLVGGAVVVDRWEDAIDICIDHPDALVVTTAGDRFGPTGWRIGSAGSGVTGAALDQARQRAEETAGRAAEADEAVSTARTRHDEARQREDALTRLVEQNGARRSATADALRRVEADRQDASTEADSLVGHVAELQERAERDSARMSELAAALPAMEAEEHEQAERGRALAEARNRLEEKAQAVGTLRSDLGVRGAGLDERRQFLEARLAQVEKRLDRDVAERREAEARRVEIDRRQLATERLSMLVTDRLAAVEAELSSLRQRRQAQSDAARAVAAALDGLRRDRSAAERELSNIRERLQRAELEDTETRLRLE